VFVNGQDIDKPTTVGLSYRQLENMTEAIKVVHEAIREKHQYRVDQICDLEGHVVTDVNQLETGGLYVAKNSYHTFKPGRYEPHGRKNIIVPLSPRDKQQTKYLWKERTLPPINSQKKHSPDHSVSSYPETRKRNQVNGVPVKAAKHTKRTPKQADYDKDDGGVFKAKGQSRDTRGAKEVRDNGDTKVDLPIDQVRAEEVKDERIKKEKQGKDINNKAPTKQADHSHSRTIQNGDRSQADQSHSRTIQNGDRSQAKGEQSKPVVNNSQNKTVQQNTKQSTYKSNSKAPPPNTTKNDVKKQEPPKDNKNYSNHDSVRSSTPKDNKAAPPSKSPTDRRSVSPAKSPVNNKAASPAKSPSPTKDKKDPTPHEEHQAATKIQANYRGHQARKEVNDLKTKKETDEKKKKEDELRAKAAKEENQAATKIQAGFRGHQARKEINQKKQVRDVKNTKEDAAAIKIQSSYRGHKARKEIADKKVKRTEKNTEEEVAATKIQAGFRGHKARQEINQKKQQRTETKNEEENAATKIQAGFRGNQARKEIDLKKKEKVKNEEEEKAATKIQAGFRGHQARKEVKKKKVFCDNHDKQLSNNLLNVDDLAENGEFNEQSESTKSVTILAQIESTNSPSILAKSESEKSPSRISKSERTKSHLSFSNSILSSHNVNDQMVPLDSSMSKTVSSISQKSKRSRGGTHVDLRESEGIGTSVDSFSPKGYQSDSETVNKEETQISDDINLIENQTEAQNESCDKTLKKENSQGSNIVGCSLQSSESTVDSHCDEVKLDGKNSMENLTLSQENSQNLTLPMESRQNLIFPKENSQNLTLPKENSQNLTLSKENSQNLTLSKENSQNLTLSKENSQNLTLSKENSQTLILSKENSKHLSKSKEESVPLMLPKQNSQIVISHKENKPDLKLPKLLSCKAVTFVDDKKMHIKRSSFNLDPLMPANIEDIKLALRRSKTFGKMSDLRIQNLEVLNNSRLPIVILPKSLSFAEDSLKCDKLGTIEKTDNGNLDSSRCKSAEAIPAFLGSMIKHHTFPEMLESDMEKMFPIFVARSKRHKSFPYFEVRKSDNSNMEGLRSATDSQASEPLDGDDFIDTDLHTRSPGDGESLTVNFEYDNSGRMEVDSRCGKLSNLGHLGSFGDSDTLDTESILKTSRTGTFDESVEIDWKKKDTSLLREIEDESIELELIKIKHSATTYLQAGVKGHLSRSYAVQKMKFQNNSDEVTVLQAAVRGMILRKHLEFHTFDDDTEVEAICQNDAAVKIQAVFRGYRVRKMDKVRIQDKKLHVKKQVTFGSVSRIEIINGECKRDLTVIGKEIEDEDSVIKKINEDFEGTKTIPDDKEKQRPCSIENTAATQIQIAYRKHKKTKTEQKLSLIENAAAKKIQNAYKKHK
ncbi:Hypothetical predicted protein, partial [Mytilus galloprovincialis]